MFIEYILLGILQGLLEWLPVSSSGQASLFYSRILGLEPLIGYRLGLIAHIGTGISAIIYFRREILRMVSSWYDVWFKLVSIATLSSLPIGYMIYKYITLEADPFIEPLTATSLIFTGIILYILDMKGERNIESISYWEMVLVGLIQGFTIIPGISRSAFTIASFSLLGFNSEESVKASFVIGIPVTILAGIYQFIELGGIKYLGIIEASTLLLTSLVTGILTIGLMIFIAKKLRERISLLLILIGSIILILYLPLFL